MIAALSLTLGLAPVWMVGLAPGWMVGLAPGWMVGLTPGWNQGHAPGEIQDARPRVRWWWHGPAVDRVELERELDAMAAAGLGGVEIVPMAFPLADPDQVVTWLSPEWGALVRDAADAARARELAVDLIVGTGWPAGSELLRGDERLQSLASERRALAGPARLELATSELAGAHPLVGLYLAPDPCERLADVRDVRPLVLDGTLKLELAEGRWNLVALVRREGHGSVSHGSPGGRGAVLDHFDAEDAEAYLGRMTAALADSFGAPLSGRLDALFVDSLELAAANWTEDLPAEFLARRGYELGPWLPFLVGDARAAEALARDLPRVRHDHARTLAELAARTGRVFAGHADALGLESRLQAYGSPWLYGMLDLYAQVDVPEGDTWVFQSGTRGGPVIDGARAILWNRYAASVAHQRGRRLVSTEAFTNTRGLFRTSLADLKQATDIALAMGVNQFVLHGYNHSPPEAGVPGWLRFGTWFDPANPWWPHLSHWSGYAARACAQLRATRPTERIAIVGPTADVWSAHGLDRTAFATTPPYLHGLWAAFSSAGSGADALGHAALAEARVEQGRLRVGAAAYEALVLVEIEALAADAAEQAALFAEAGGRVLVVGAPPSRAPGLRDAAARDERVRAAASRLRAGERVRTLKPPPIVAARGARDPDELERDARLLAWADAALDEIELVRDVVLEPAHPRLLTARRRGSDGRDAWFVANVARDRELSFRATFPVEPGWPRVTDLERDTHASSGSTQPTRSLELRLGPLESCWVEISPERPDPLAGPERPGPLAGIGRPLGAPHEPAAARALTGPWTVTLHPIAGGVRTLELEDLTDLSTRTDLADFAGRAIYRTRFRVAPGERRSALDLGVVHGSAEIRLGGRTTVRPWGERRLEGALESGEHVLEVHVLTAAWNWARASDDRVASFHTRAGGPPEPIGLLGPVRLLRLE